MNQPATQHDRLSSPASLGGARDRGTSKSLVTLFTMPKAFGGKTDLIQRNAIQSWAQLQPQVEVLLVGDELGIGEAAKEMGVRHATGLQYNQFGTPLVSSAFDIARSSSTSPLLAYCNSDVILLPDFVQVMERLLAETAFPEFVAFGRRIDLTVDRRIDFSTHAEVTRLLSESRTMGKVSSQVCKEYFVFPRNQYQQIPPFAIGRGNWDNWMIYHARKSGVPVVNVSRLLTAIHQAHDYQHTGASRMQCYVSGPEARENERLAGGKHLLSGSLADWRMTAAGIKREPPWLTNPAFWADIPRFLRLAGSLLRGRG